MSEFFIYSIARENADVCKVGMSSNVNSRILALQTGSAEPLVLVFKSNGLNRTAAQCAEKTCHYLLSKYKISGEWFSVPHDVSRMAAESAIDLVTAGHVESDFPFLVEQTRFQFEGAISV